MPAVLFSGDNTALSFTARGLITSARASPPQTKQPSLRNSLQLECVRVSSVLLKHPHNR